MGNPVRPEEARGLVLIGLSIALLLVGGGFGPPRADRLGVFQEEGLSGMGLLGTVFGSVLGDNALEQIVLNVTRARRLEMERTGSGAIAAIAFTPEEPTAVRLAAIRITGESGGAFGFILALAGLLLVTLILLLRRVVD